MKQKLSFLLIALISSIYLHSNNHIVNTHGNLIDYFYSTTNPLSQKITSLIK